MRLIDLDKLEPFAPDNWYKGRQLLALPVVYQPSNDPLTLEELREMDGEPVWAVVVQTETPEAIGWMLVDSEFESAAGTHDELGFDSYGPGGWLAYRRKPEEEMI